jgi:hypothetical protein
MAAKNSTESYSTEKRLVSDLSAHVTNGRGSVKLSKLAFEFGHSSGWTDVVGLGGRKVLHAFEAKLNRWKDALDQARKNRCFAHYCYVALPATAAKRALESRQDFEKFGVGLVVVSTDSARLAIRPKRNAPLLPWITKVAVATLERSRR